MKITVEGCCHGELDRIYASIGLLEKREGVKVDLLIICGDFQAIRNPEDLECMAVPSKYRTINSFYKYYSGECTAPVLTIFIGGNHESSAFMQELPYGGWVAPNIFYMGYANVVQIGGMRIGGVSGIFKGGDYCKGHHERPPYDQNSVRSCYHWRILEAFRVKKLTGHIDIMLTHDWPRGVYHFGDVQSLLKNKKYFRKEVEDNTLGNPVAMEILKQMKPSYWFSAHLHCKFSALIGHPDGKETKFLALDKCLPRRKFLQVIDIATPNHSGPFQINLDPEWLAILKATNHMMRLSFDSLRLDDRQPISKDLEGVEKAFGGDFTYPSELFIRTAPIYSPNNNNNRNNSNNNLLYINSQTEWWCSRLDIVNPFKVFVEGGGGGYGRKGWNGGSGFDSSCGLKVENPDEIKLDDDDEGDASGGDDDCLKKVENPDEIKLDDGDDETDCLVNNKNKNKNEDNSNRDVISGDNDLGMCTNKNDEGDGEGSWDGGRVGGLKDETNPNEIRLDDDGNSGGDDNDDDDDETTNHADDNIESTNGS